MCVTMKINPIDSGNQTQATNFKSKIVKNEFLEAGYDLAHTTIETSMMKDLNKVKCFYDSLAKIKLSKIADTVCFEKTEKGACVVADGKKTVLLDEQNKNLQPGYLAVKAINLYAEKLGLPTETTVLDTCQQGIAKKMEELDTLKKGFAAHLKGMLKDITKS